jgi:hypothetical protein
MIEKSEVQRRYDLWSQGYWEVPDNLDTTGFDFNWKPEPYDRPYIHQFGTQHQKTGGPRFVIPEHEGIKYQDFQHAIRLADINNRSWRPLVNNSTIDFSWHPDDTDPPFIYVFGNQWYDSHTMPTYQYRVKGATDKKYMINVVATLLPYKDNWEIPGDIDDSMFDYSWIPNPHEPPLIHQFGTQWQKTGGPRYIVEGATETKYHNEQNVIRIATENRCYRPLVSNIEFDYSWHPDADEPPYIYVFGNQWYDAELMPTLLYRVKGAIEKKYINDLKVTLLPNKEKFEILTDREIEFDYSWVPNPNDPPYEYVFGNQWFNSITMPTLIYKNNKAIAKKYIDDVHAIILPNKSKFKILEEVEDFDYSWVPNPNDPPLTYVFGNQYYSPEFMPTVMYRTKGASETKYVKDIKANLKINSIHCDDSVFDEVNSHVFETRYAYFNCNKLKIDYTMLRNADEKLYIHLIDNVGAVIPREAKINLYDKLTDYPYVKYHTLGNKNNLLDVIFFSNGEECADDNYKHLLSLNLPNRIIRVDGVKGRVASQHAAANSSNTPWYFLINAKLKVNKDFDFNWHPDIFKSRRHYIFTATNPVNGLEYGHQAIVANNKKLTLNTVVRGLDFTMDSPTEVINVNSGTSMYNTSPYDTWRTAFREMIKLYCNTDQESIDRGLAWLNRGDGNFGEYSIMGARDAVKYYNSVTGNMEKLMLSYDWEWLHQHYQNNCP